MTTGDHTPIIFTENLRRYPLYLVILLSICVVLLSSCGSNTKAVSSTSNALTTPIRVTQVSITMTATFQPANLQVPVGTTVTWTNNDNIGHTVTFKNAMRDRGILLARSQHTVPDPFASKQGMIDSGILLAEGGTVSYTFTSKGTFTYYDAMHPSIRGVVVVNA